MWCTVRFGLVLSSLLLFKSAAFALTDSEEFSQFETFASEDVATQSDNRVYPGIVHPPASEYVGDELICRERETSCYADQKEAYKACLRRAQELGRHRSWCRRILLDDSCLSCYYACRLALKRGWNDPCESPAVYPF